MGNYTVIKRGENIRHCLNIPPEFVEQELEITIKPVQKRGDSIKKIESLFKNNQDVKPFESILDPAMWQKEQRSGW